MSKKSFPHIMFYCQILNRVFLCLIFAIFFAKNANAQQFNNWYFPFFSGITFNTTPPSALVDGQIFQNISCAVMSDKSGNLLFYTDGVRVWNRNHQIMPNGNGLFGDFSQTNSVLIIPFINDNSKYYLFTADGVIVPPYGIRGYCYSIVDMNADNGNGNIIVKNQLLYTPSAEKFCATPHANGTDIWLITKDLGNKFYTFKITCSGIVPLPVVSQVGNDISINPIFSLVGDIKASPDGKVIGMTNFQSNYFQLFKFDNATGLLSQPIKINSIRAPYGVEFSPDNSKLYIGSTKDSIPLSSTGIISQFNLSIYDSNAITNSSIIIGEKISNSCFGLQLGPDKKIYHIGDNVGYIDVINNPNLFGLNANFIPNAIYLNGKTATRRLPYAPTFLFINQNVQ
ncbi:MAG: hypothetical protein H7178_01840, partial [Chitinophagaceae bacterium]|nr:hypothetical protein [Chitinophagaceae bacterium]